MSEANIWQPRSVVVLSMAANNKRVEERLVALNDQTDFTLQTFIYSPGTGSLEIHKNGLILDKDTDWTELTEDSFRLIAAADADDVITATGFTEITGRTSDVAKVTEQVILTDGQVIVPFVSVLADVGEFIVSGTGVSGSHILVLGTDYTVETATAIKLTSSFPAGVAVTGTSTVGGGYEAVDVVYDNTTSGLAAENTQDAIDELASAGALLSYNKQTGFLYGLTPSDTNKVVSMGSAVANIIILDTNLNQNFSVGAKVEIRQLGAGITTIQAVLGVSLNGIDGGSVDLPFPFQANSIDQQDTDDWIYTGAGIVS